MLPYESVQREQIYKCPYCDSKIKEQKPKLTWGFGVFVMAPLILNSFISNTELRLLAIALPIVVTIYLIWKQKIVQVRWVKVHD